MRLKCKRIRNENSDNVDAVGAHPISVVYLAMQVRCKKIGDWHSLCSSALNTKTALFKHWFLHSSQTIPIRLDFFPSFRWSCIKRKLKILKMKINSFWKVPLSFIIWGTFYPHSIDWMKNGKSILLFGNGAWAPRQNIFFRKMSTHTQIDECFIECLSIVYLFAFCYSHCYVCRLKRNWSK